MRDINNKKRVPIHRASCVIRAYHLCVLWLVITGCAIYALSGVASITGTHFLGLPVFCAGCLLGLFALREIGSSYDEEIVIFGDSKLVTSGIYSVIRHPMRVGLALEALGSALLSQQLMLLFLWGLLVIFQVVRSLSEDRILISCYGAAAREYQKSVPAMNIVGGLLRSGQKRSADT